MEIVIKIPDKVYHRIKSDNGHGYCTLRDQDERVIVNAICNSVRLDQGHGRLIDIDNIESIMMEDSVDRMVHTKGDEVDWYIEAPTVVEADKENNNG